MLVEAGALGSAPVFRLALSATSGNIALVPAANILFDGSGTNRTFQLLYNKSF